MRLNNTTPLLRRRAVLFLLASAAAAIALVQTPDAWSAAGSHGGAKAGKLDCSKVHAYYCPLVVGGPYITGDAGATTAGSTVSASDKDGKKSKDVTAGRDGGFVIRGANLGDMSMPKGSTIKVCVGSDCCDVTVEACPPIGVEVEPKGVGIH